MKYFKSAISLEQQADLLLSRGFLAERDILISRLRSVNYYRLSGYWYPFKNEDDTFKHNTTLEMIWQMWISQKLERLFYLAGQNVRKYSFLLYFCRRLV